MDYKILPMEKIRLNKYNPNRMSAKTMTVLRNFIQEQGFLQPILVRAVEGDVYEVVDGEHRFKAMGELGATQIPAVVIAIDEDIAKVQTINMNNLRGNEMDRIKLAEILRELKDKYTEAELESKLGYTQQEIQAFDDLLDFDPNLLSDESEAIAKIEAATADQVQDPLQEFAIPVNPGESAIIQTALATKKGRPTEQAVVELCNEYLLN